MLISDLCQLHSVSRSILEVWHVLNMMYKVNAPQFGKDWARHGMQESVIEILPFVSRVSWTRRSRHWHNAPGQPVHSTILVTKTTGCQAIMAT